MVQSFWALDMLTLAEIEAIFAPKRQLTGTPSSRREYTVKYIQRPIQYDSRTQQKSPR